VVKDLALGFDLSSQPLVLDANLLDPLHLALECVALGPEVAYLACRPGEIHLRRGAHLAGD